MLQNESVNDWLKLVKTNSAHTMQSIAEKRLNPNHYHLSPEAKKRLVWLHVLYYDQRGNVSSAARKIGISRPWISHLKQLFERNQKNPRCLEPQSRVPNDCTNRIRIPKTTADLIIKIRDDSLNAWGKEKIAWALQRDYQI